MLVWGLERHDDCRQGFHEFLWMPKVWEHVCFFCLAVEKLYDSEDEWIWGGGKMMEDKVLKDDLEPESTSDS